MIPATGQTSPNAAIAQQLNALFSMAEGNPDVRFALPVSQQQEDSSFCILRLRCWNPQCLTEKSGSAT